MNQRVLFVVLLCLATFLTAASAFAGPEKVSPLLRKYTHPDLPVVFDHPRSLEDIGVLDASSGTPMIRCLIQGSVTRAQLEALGVTVGTQAGPVFTASVPADRILQVSDLPGIVRIEAARRSRTTLDNATTDTNVRPEVHGSLAPPYAGNTGAGVLIGNVDSGVDYTHEDFKDALGQTRFDRIWDQTVSGTPPTGFTYGAEWSTAQINAGTATVTNPDGHGTHVLGIMGGDGSATGAGGAPAYTYVGVAPEAALIAVKTNFTDTGIVDGCDWIFQRGAALGIPAVANLSLGNQFGPHDGTDPLEVALDALTGPGKIIVTSASNDRGQGIHARGTLPVSGPPTNLQFSFDVDPFTAAPGSQNDLVLFSGWYEGADDYTISVISPNGQTVSATKGNISAVNTADGAVQIENGTTTPSNGDTEVFIALFDYQVNNPPEPGTWTVRFDRVTSSGAEIDVWMYYSRMGARFVLGATDDVTVGNPACAGELIAVAAYATKSVWPSRDGNNYQWSPPPTLGEIADFSGRGPTRTGGQKPDIAAPGFGVSAALSDDVAINGNTIPLIHPGDVHWIQSGTSMSSPMVAGLAGLIMAKEGPLTPAQVKTLLQQHARTDAFTGAVWNEDWGWGKMNAEAADILPPAVALTAPNGGESYLEGAAIPVGWSASDNFGVTEVDLHYSTDGGATFPHVIALAQPNTGSHAWTAPAVSSTQVRVRITAHDTAGNSAADASDADFEIVVPDTTPPSVTVLAPNGGESLVEGASTVISWTASDTGLKPGVTAAAAAIAGVDSVSLWYSVDNGGVWLPIASGEENDGSYTWTVPSAATDSALVRVVAHDPSLNAGEDRSDAVFTIAAAGAVGEGGLPVALTLSQSRPNPLRGSGGAEIRFGMPAAGNVALQVFDARGRLVATVVDREYAAGYHAAVWDGRLPDGALAPSGLYFYRLETPAGVLHRKLMVVR